jgi:hypothetical protein
VLDWRAIKQVFHGRSFERIVMSESGFSGGADSPLRQSWKETLLLRKLPYVILLALTLLGVAFTSMTHQPIDGYWEFLAVATGVVCVSTGWSEAHQRQARFRLAWTQAAHWAAILVAMNIVLLPGVQRMLTASATGLALLLLVALGTFLAGIHISLELCFLGIAMAVAVPAITWLKQSALFLVLAGVAVIGLTMTFWRRQ